ncbi:MAG: hypothetical protein ABI314_01950 [Gemmatimonadaceae bacterium]
MSDRFGQAYGLTIMSPIIGEPDVDGTAHDVDIRRELRALNALAESPFARVSTTHLARWVVIDEAPYESEPAKVDHLESKYLLFTSNFDGGTLDDTTALNDYLELLRTQISEVIERVYGHCVGFPGTSTRAAFQSYMRRCRIPTTFLFGAYGEATQEQVQRSLSLQRSLSDFVRAQQVTRPPPEDLKQRFFQFATTAGLIAPKAPL